MGLTRRIGKCWRCCVYVKMIPCSGGPDNRYLHQKNIAACPAVIVDGGNCYQNPGSSATRVRLPSSGVRVTAFGDGYADCAECEGRDPEDGEGGSGPPGDPSGGGGGCWWCGGGAGGAGGGTAAGGGVAGPGEPEKGYQFTACEDNPEDYPASVWVVKQGTVEASASGTIRYGAACYHGTISGNGSAIPEGAQKVYISGMLADCTTCRGGYPTSICPDQVVPAGFEAPWLTEAAVDGAESPVTFEFRGICVRFTPMESSSPFPDGVPILTRLPAGVDDCTNCVLGALAELCDVGYDNSSVAPVVWVRKADLPPTGETWIDRHTTGFCYSISGDAELIPRPDDAEIWTLQNRFTTCENCRCGLAGAGPGWVAVSCVGNTYAAPSPWVRTSDLTPDTGRYYFGAGKACWMVDTDVAPSDIPNGARVVRPVVVFFTCVDCLSSIIAEDGPGTGTGGQGKPPKNDPPIGHQQTPHPQAALRNCETEEIIHKSARGAYEFGRIVEYDGACWEVISTLTPTDGEITPTAIWRSCPNCLTPNTRMFDVWQSEYNCTTGEWSNPHNVESRCSNDDPYVWTLQPESSETIKIYRCGVRGEWCKFSGSVGTPPAKPEFTPAGCPCSYHLCNDPELVCVDDLPDILTVTVTIGVTFSFNLVRDHSYSGDPVYKRADTNEQTLFRCDCGKWVVFISGGGYWFGGDGQSLVGTYNKHDGPSCGSLVVEVGSLVIS